MSFESVMKRLHSGVLCAGASLIWFFAGALVQYLNNAFFTSVGFIWIIVLACFLYCICDYALEYYKQVV